MKQNVTNIVEGFTNTLRHPYAYAKLSCGHSHKVELRPDTRVCADCGTEYVCYKDHKCVACECGSTSGKTSPLRDPHNPEDRLTTVGDEVDCAYCDAYHAQLNTLRSTPREAISHTRFQPRGDHGTILVYARDNESPTGVRLMLGIDATDKVYEVLTSKSRGFSPLSPTERR